MERHGSWTPSRARGNFAVASKPLEGGPVGCTVERVPTRVFPDAWPRSGVRSPMNESPPPAGFPTTHWSRVARAGGPPTPEARAALAELCSTYW